MNRRTVGIVASIALGAWPVSGHGQSSPSSATPPQSTPVSRVPDWTADAIWYQVLVPRFANGAPENDPPYVRPWQGDWGVPDDDDSRPVRTQLFTRAYGGDLQGLREKLAYLQDLGVNTLYLNPIFSAPSEHKYDTADLRHVDDTLAVAGALAGAKSESADPASWGWTASDRYFLSFLNDAHARGFRVVLDGVFNHVGCDFWAFQDVRARGRASAYADWFDIFQWEPGLKYRAWDGENGQLPEFRRAGDGLHPAVEAHVFAVVRRWMDPNGDGDPRDGIDGWRLDAADKLPPGFCRRLRRVVKSINPEAVILGEIWTNARPWLGGDQFDMITNYRFSDPVVRFLLRGEARWSASRASDALLAVHDRHPRAMTLAMANLLGSHDTPRVVSMLLNPTTYPGTEVEPVPQRDRLVPTGEDFQRMRLAVVLQFTWPGAPMVYYGDERGMAGGDDPFCRAPMHWHPVEGAPDLRGLYRRLGALRRERVEWRRGRCRVLLADDARRLLVFERFLGRFRSVVAINGDGRDHALKLHLQDREGWRWLRVDGGSDPSWGSQEGNEVKNSELRKLSWAVFILN
jgi:cyclomaltodextrinase